MKSKSNIAREYRYKYPDKPTKALARIIYNENKLLFRDTEDARFMLRYIEGKAGAKNKQFSINVNPDFVIEEPRPMNPYKLPDSDAVDIKPYILKGFSKALILNDIHLPYHDQSAITTCFNYAKRQKPDVIVINGDLLDFYGLSFWDKDPRKRNFAYELDQFKEFINVLKRIFKCKIVLKFGNHEFRYERFLLQKAKELVGVEEFELSNIIKARAEGIDIVAQNQLIHANELIILHGHELGRGFFSPVNAARGLQLRAKVTALQGDCHKTSEHTETDLKGVIKTTWSVGCLCGLKPEYMPYNSWNHGFAIIELDKNKHDFQVHNKRIYNGKVL
jgi:predicted phosphodiesterase